MSKATVSYHVRRLGQATDERFAKRYDWEAIQRFYDAGHRVRECVKAFGFSSASWSDAVKRWRGPVPELSQPDQHVLGA